MMAGNSSLYLSVTQTVKVLNWSPMLCRSQPRRAAVEVVAVAAARLRPEALRRELTVEQQLQPVDAAAEAAAEPLQQAPDSGSSESEAPVPSWIGASEHHLHLQSRPCEIILLDAHMG